MTIIETSLVGTDLGLTGLSGVPAAEGPQKVKEYTSDQEVRWCPGCGDYVILATVRSFLADLGLRRDLAELLGRQRVEGSPRGQEARDLAQRGVQRSAPRRRHL